MIAGMTDTVRAAVLAEALPWLQHYRNKIVVVKYGGNAMVDEELKRAFAADMVFLRTVGAKPVVVHGVARRSMRCCPRLGLKANSKAASGLPAQKSWTLCAWFYLVKSAAIWST